MPGDERRPQAIFGYHRDEPGFCARQGEAETGCYSSRQLVLTTDRILP
jgi:hypothetical protein